MTADYLYIWGLNRARLPIALVKMETTGDGVIFIPVPETLYQNTDVWYVVPEMTL